MRVREGGGVERVDDGGVLLLGGWVVVCMDGWRGGGRRRELDCWRGVRKGRKR